MIVLIGLLHARSRLWLTQVLRRAPHVLLLEIGIEGTNRRFKSTKRFLYSLLSTSPTLVRSGGANRSERMGPCAFVVPARLGCYC